MADEGTAAKAQWWPVWSGWDAMRGPSFGGGGLTFIISTMVLRAIMAMMVYSKGGDTTNCHMRYWKLCLFWGMCLVSGLALMAKSMQALCGKRQRMRRVTAGKRSAHNLPGQLPRSLAPLAPDGLLTKTDSSVAYGNLGSHHTAAPLLLGSPWQAVI